MLLASWLGEASAQQVILSLKNGDRLTGQILTESTNQVVLTNLYGQITIPVTDIAGREILQPPPPPPEPPPAPAPSTNVVAAPSAARTNVTAAPRVPPSRKPSPGPIEPANPEAASIKDTPRFWKHDLQFGLNLRYSTRDQQEYLFIARSTYGRPPLRHIFDVNFTYGRTDGDVSANRITASQKTEYEISKKTYVFNLIGGGYDEVRRIDAQYEISPGFGVEVLRTTNYWNLVWKTENGFTFQRQHRADDDNVTNYSLRIAQILAWRVWEKLTADAKIEFFPSVEDFGEFRLRLESNLRYPLTDRLNLNMVVINLYDSDSAERVKPNDLQIRSTIGVKF